MGETNCVTETREDKRVKRGQNKCKLLKDGEKHRTRVGNLSERLYIARFAFILSLERGGSESGDKLRRGRI